MSLVTRTVTIDLDPEEVSKILISAMGLPADTEVTFNIGQRSEPMDRYSSSYCRKVSCTYKQATELDKHSTSKLIGTSQFDDRDWADR